MKTAIVIVSVLVASLGAYGAGYFAVEESEAPLPEGTICFLFWILGVLAVWGATGL